MDYFLFDPIYPTPPLGQDMTQGQFLTGLNSEISFSLTSCFTKAEEPSLSYYFTHSWRENNRIHTFPKGISAMWNAIRIWTRVAVSISYDDNHYAISSLIIQAIKAVHFRLSSRRVVRFLIE